MNLWEKLPWATGLSSWLKQLMRTWNSSSLTRKTLFVSSFSSSSKNTLVPFLTSIDAHIRFIKSSNYISCILRITAGSIESQKSSSPDFATALSNALALVDKTIMFVIVLALNSFYRFCRMCLTCTHSKASSSTTSRPALTKLHMNLYTVPSSMYSINCLNRGMSLSKN